VDNPDGADNQSEFGKLVLHSLPTTETKEMVVSYLSRIVKNVPAEKLAEKIMTTPYVLSKNIAVKKGERIAQNLRDLGARAEFVPHDPDARGIEPLSEIAIRPKFESLQRLPEQINPPRTARHGSSTSGKHLVSAIVVIILIAVFSLLGWQVYHLVTERLLK
jgi:hypothetical protein